ncbi:glutathione S-transferase family protein [Grimontia sp. S25]|uniref:Glutathione S-transferase family protein n=1 Tax=Grimontia sedimenti TaxID=2711294 RepID=A0A6M1RWM1_9GAMM|nr:glutathione S-transferase family protein [Grimontia sedimenti]NGO00278.1 glutathione S-transferase family protein [Grimontia sedimenti]
MGKLIEGRWLTDDQLREWEEKQYSEANGRFVRGVAKFRNWVTATGDAGPSGEAGFKAEAGRYHLFAALNCPWAHRTLIYRKVKGLENVVGLSLVAPLRTEQGWVFDNTEERFTDNLLGLEAMHQLYVKSNPDFTGRVTVPVLWDKKTQTIVSNESSEIIRMFNSAFNEITGDTQDFYPEALAKEIDDTNDWIFNTVNNGVYKSGFARTQEAYDEAVTALFASLEEIEARLGKQAFLLGDAITEADWRLLPTLVRFDVGYFTAFKCNLKALRDYPNISAYLKTLVQQPGVKDTIDLDVYRRGYNSKSPLRNPHGIVPVAPYVSFLD